MNESPLSTSLPEVILSLCLARGYELGRKQQKYLNQLRMDPKFAKIERRFAARFPRWREARIFWRHRDVLCTARLHRACAALQAQISEDRSLQAALSSDTRNASDEVATAK